MVARSRSPDELDVFGQGGLAMKHRRQLPTACMRSSSPVRMLMGSTEGPPQEAELAALTDAIDAYERCAGPTGEFPVARGELHPLTPRLSPK
jgi:hypothetical protein